MVHHNSRVIVASALIQNSDAISDTKEASKQKIHPTRVRVYKNSRGPRGRQQRNSRLEVSRAINFAPNGFCQFVGARN